LTVFHPEEWLSHRDDYAAARAVLLEQLAPLFSDRWDEVQHHVIAATAAPSGGLDDGQQLSQAYAELAEALASLPRDTLVHLWHQWIASPSMVLHLLVPATLRRLSAPEPRLALQVLDWGLSYPEPSHNRNFLEAAHAVLGSEITASRFMLQLHNASAAGYWLLPLLSRDRANPKVAADLSELTRRLRPSASYIPRRWWPFW